MTNNAFVNETVTEDGIKKAKLCKCGRRADFIKDYWVTENKVLKEKDSEDTITRKLEMPAE